MSAVRLQLLGPPRAWRDEQPLAFKTRKTLALLAYLAAERGLHPRDQLAALLWPDRGEAEARNSLRSALVYLRQALGDADAALAVTRETVGLSLSPSLVLDIQVLAQRLARQPAMVPGLRAELERAVAAYAGPFLEGLSVQDAPEFEDWVAGQRAHWLSVVGELLDRLATLQADERDLGAAVGTLERWVALDPGEEGAWQRLIAAHLERGDGAAARRAWTACRAALADLDVAPSAATETVAARINTFAPARRASPIGSGRSDPVGLDVSVVPLVGRGRELARLRQAYARAQTAGAQVVVLEGETDSGKTRLATEFRRGCCGSAGLSWPRHSSRSSRAAPVR